MLYTSDEIKKLLQGKWILKNSKKRHYLIFKREDGMDIFHSKHRGGTYTIEQNDAGEWVLELESARHERILNVIDADHITMAILYGENKSIFQYKRYKSVLKKCCNVCETLLSGI